MRHLIAAVASLLVVGCSPRSGDFAGKWSGFGQFSQTCSGGTVEVDLEREWTVIQNSETLTVAIDNEGYVLQANVEGNVATLSSYVAQPFTLGGVTSVNSIDSGSMTLSGNKLSYAYASSVTSSDGNNCHGSASGSMARQK